MKIDAHLDLAAPATDAARTPARRAERAAVKLSASLRKSGEMRMKIEVLDISIHGFRMETHRTLRADTPIWLTLPGLQPIAARVVRQSGPEIGCEFTTPLHPAVLEKLVSLG